MFKKTLTAGILAASLALTSMTPSTASAQISDEDAIAGILTLLFIGAAIKNSRDNDPAPVTQTHPQRDRNWRVLPANCLRDIETRNRGTVRMFTQSCLNNHYTHVSRLPEGCRIQVRATNGNQRRGFRHGCMRTAGFRVSRH